MKRLKPSTEIFNEVKQAAISIFETYDDTYGYATGKIARINSILNNQDNVMVFYRMLDPINQAAMRVLLSPEALEYVKANYQ